MQNVELVRYAQPSLPGIATSGRYLSVDRAASIFKEISNHPPLPKEVLAQKVKDAMKFLKEFTFGTGLAWIDQRLFHRYRSHNAGKPR